MKTLADWKRLLKPGQLWHAYNHPMKKDMGTRKVVRVLSNAVTFDTGKQGSLNKESWLYFPKAKEFKIVDDKTVQIFNAMPDGRTELCLTYTLQGEP